ncbi:hypothetical protein AB0269_02695 [Microbacterium sp. NPDC077644]|uniref:hypothetical protein n=1 Tax=Microbacterium sp. NPDC077644 TaxID=3155055 RepID=UPI00344B2BE8
MSRRVARPRNALRLPRFVAVFVAVLAVAIGTVTPIQAATASTSASIAASTTTSGRATGDLAQTTRAKTYLSGFKAGNIISDAVFTSKNTMSATQIQSFLNSKVSKCVVGKDEDGLPYVCLKDLKVPTQSKAADAYCSAYAGAASESAARILYKVAQACNINPQVLIVMLQKEQGLVTHIWPSNWRYNKAMGQACPDTAPCDTAFAGFFAQVYGAARQMQIYMEGKYFQWYKAGQTWRVQYHPNAACGSGSVYIANKATEALYYYTPYQPNAAAMRAGYGTGDGCSSYGNRNFYNYFTDWFGSTGSADVCDVPGNVGSASRQYVVTTGLNARKAPNTGCQDGTFVLSEGTILQARRVTIDGDWIEVLTLEGPRWVAREYLRYADTKEAACTVPPGTSAANGSYVVRTATAAKLAPWAACDLRSSTLSAGTVLQATRVSSTGNWLEVQTQAGPRWVARSAVGTAAPADVDGACAEPAGTTKASQQYVVTSTTPGWVSPLASCGKSEQLTAGTVLQATRLSYSEKWLEVQTQAGLRWVDRSALASAAQADIDAACVDPAGTSAKTDQYVIRKDTLAWLKPLAKCGTAARDIGTGTVVQATRVSYSGKWIEIRTGAGARWVASDAVAVCADPADTRTASRQYVVRVPAQALVSPLATCGTAVKHWGAGTSPTDLGTGTVLQATRISYSGNWMEIRTSAGERWVRSDAIAVCPNPAGMKKASKQYVVLKATKGLVSPLAECGTAAVHWGTGTAPQSLGVGAVVQATRISSSGKWLQVQTSSGLRWVPRSDVRER